MEEQKNELVEVDASNGKGIFNELVTYDKAVLFLLTYAQGYSIRKTAEITGIDWQYHYQWKRGAENYRLALEIVEEVRADVGSDAIFTRGIMGTDRELTFQGKKTGETIKEYSDVLAIIAMKARRPHQYRENVNANVTINVPIGVQIMMPAPADPQLDNTAQPLLVDSDTKKE